MSDRENPEVATHVLVPVSTAEKLRELSKKTRITQSEFLREAVEDLLKKYAALEKEEKDKE
ncbi:MAG: ribbon-helix-helix domain-containing protein [Myxococcaceae bacterium]|nr:ribbon-helix-helix domain-containing protein [Myxococcaceae bacterium]